MISDSISVVIPCYNEEHRILTTIRSLLEFLKVSFRQYEILLVDDGSTDRTWEIIRALRDSLIRPIRLPVNRGKGAAVMAGMLEARGEYRFFTDADLPYDLSAFLCAVAELSSGRCQLVVGARDHPRSLDKSGTPRLRKTASRVFAAVAGLLLGTDVRDSQCGFKGFTAGAVRALSPHASIQGYAFDVEILLLARRLRLPVCRIPVTLVKDYDSRIRLPSDGLSMLRDLLRITLRHRVCGRKLD